MRPVITGLVVSAAACLVAFGCGSDDPEPEAAVVWFNISQMSTGNCDRAYGFQLPAGTAASTIQGTIEGTPRVEDGEGGNIVDCRVRANGSGAFQVALQLRSTEIRNFQASGTLSQGSGGTLRVSLQSDRTGALEQSDCSADVEVVRDGAIWIRELRCEALTDQRSTNTLCLGAGGLLFERCQG